MNVKIGIAASGIFGFILVIVFTLWYFDDSSINDIDDIIPVDVVTKNKSSRPGCQETNSCYIPYQITVSAGESITWRNEDAAFHSVTSGSYDNPISLFDSGHLDPDQLFTVILKDPGKYDYFCTLHPWMNGTILVER